MGVDKILFKNQVVINPEKRTGPGKDRFFLYCYFVLDFLQ